MRISPENAAKLYALVAKNGLQNTQVVLTGTTPGGEFKVASPAGASRYGQADLGGYQSGDNHYTQLQTRPSFFERLFGGPYYDSQGNYGQAQIATSCRTPVRPSLMQASMDGRSRFKPLDGPRFVRD